MRPVREESFEDILDSLILFIVSLTLNAKKYVIYKQKSENARGTEPRCRAVDIRTFFMEVRGSVLAWCSDILTLFRIFLSSSGTCRRCNIN